MLRVVIILAVSLFACSKDQPAPTAPAGKAASVQAIPSAPDNLRVEALTDTSALVAWDAAESATDYDINYKKIGGKWKNRPHKGATKQHSTLYGLEPNTEYRWAVRAENRDGPSRWVFGDNFRTLSHSTFSSSEDGSEPFNIELVFLDKRDFSSTQMRWMREVAQQWDQFFFDMPDWTPTATWNVSNYMDRAYVPVQHRLRKGKTLDDLLILVKKVETWELPPSIWGPYSIAGMTKILLYRPLESQLPSSTEGRTPLLAVIAIHTAFFDEFDLNNEAWWKRTFHHELGHAFGIGESPAWIDGIVWETKTKSVFTGPNALLAYQHMTGNDNATGIPLEEVSTLGSSGRPTPIHWAIHSPMHWGLFNHYWLKRSNNSLPNISIVSLGAFEDIGWAVNYDRGVFLPPQDGVPPEE